MSRNPETKGYVSWTDVQTVWRYLEGGYNVTLQLRSEVRSPVGEQQLKFYLELDAWDQDKQPVPLSGRVLGQFPTPGASTMPGALLALLYKCDAALSKARLWTEPTIAVKPRAELAKSK